MKRKIFIFILWPLAQMIAGQIHAQSLSPQVIASCGGYQSNASGSLSFTSGEANTKTLTSANHMLTQGFQQPYKLILNLKAYLQGYYDATVGEMRTVLYNQGELLTIGTECDTILVQLHESVAPYNVIQSVKGVLQTNGTLVLSGVGQAGMSYYIGIRHRNSVETWSANPITLGDNTTYDFSTAATQAFGDNQVQVAPGTYAFYSGDIDQSGGVDGDDFNFLDPDVQNGNGGYLSTDLDGSGGVDGDDFNIFDPNAQSGVGAFLP
ncbi:MAG: hypothetical protein JNJ58_12065 [Chitinophagaceae bacterium]|nr:hypothetical protein [Chitinophagaceae bacterium]